MESSQRNDWDWAFAALSACLVFALTFIFSLSLTSSPWAEAIPGHDSSMFIYMGREMARGGVPYLDFTDHKGISIILANALGWLMPHVNRFGGIYWVELLSLLAFTGLTYHMGRQVLDRPRSLLAVAVSLLVLDPLIESGNLTELYALAGIMLTLLAYLRYFEANSLPAWSYFLVGLSGAFVFNLRANMIISWLPLIALIFVHLLIHKNYAEMKRAVAWTSLGILTFILPVSLYLLYQGAFAEMVNFSILFNLQYLNDSKLTTEEILMKLEEKLAFYHLLGLGGLGLLACLVKDRGRGQTYWRLGGYLLAFGATFYSTLLSGRFYPHYFMVLVPFFSLLIIQALRLFDLKRGQALVNLVLIVLVAYLFKYPADIFYNRVYSVSLAEDHPTLVAKVDQLGPGFNGQLKGPGDWQWALGTDERYVWALKRSSTKNKYEAASQRIVAESQPGETLYSHRIGGAFYLLADRQAPSRYFNLPAVDLDQAEAVAKEFRSDLTRQPPQMLVIEDKLKARSPLDRSQVETDFLAWIQNNYEEIDQVGEFHLYKKLPARP
ncbi:ArnT family glycosyltransferase [Aerococcus sanguinicola]|uniref:ArnT family glycosyltransferase n=1 Tax=unclassified Aerococcus TaxID=2618060 RepID=UPI0008A52FD8|nr:MULTISPECIES: hypothetical protein [unclassified Aerococcus]KAB0647968.1 hypothetical protein F6I01_00570 [Aerococcus sanguinicola]MDK6233468.1 hypothetical protein [Aerococcus sp. UMB10185]MDK6855549.1 hypothetical protein [Aerococcus sp. UMB7533]MDK8502268.1 hypothetical protein [Aerococcus sp. UMB1112A]OFN02390.1 hypothetical protein HMPREF2626_06520 [Aerococcus sp. HMSC062A02]